MTKNQWIVSGCFALALASPMRADTLDELKASLANCKNCLHRPLLQARLNYRLKMIQYAETGMAGMAGSVPGMTAGARSAFAGISGAAASIAGSAIQGNVRAPSDNTPLRSQTAMSVYVSVDGTSEINPAEIRLSIEEQFRQLGINVLPHTAPPGFPVFNLIIKEVVTSSSHTVTSTTRDRSKPLGQQETTTSTLVQDVPVAFELSAELRRLVPGTTTAKDPIRDEAIWKIAESGETEGVASIGVADEALKLAIHFVDAWASVNRPGPPIAFKPRPPIVPGPPPQSNQQEIGLLHETISALNQGPLDSLYDVHSSQRDMVEKQLSDLEDAGQQVLYCQYGTPFPQNSIEAARQGSYNNTDYSFWYPSAPPDILKDLLSTYSHPFMRLGLISLTKCPSTAAAAEQLFRLRLDTGPLANFREGAPVSTKLQPAPKATVDSPEYLAWKKFPSGSKASYTAYGLNEYKPGTNGYRQTKISSYTLTLESINDERAVVRNESTVSGKVAAGIDEADTHSSEQQTINARRIAPVDDPNQVVTRGEETLVLNGKNIATQWECFTQAGDPLTFTKTWTSAEVPGGLVRLQTQTHSKGIDGEYRHISQTLYAPIDGIDARLGDGRPRGAANPARPTATTIPAPQTPPPARPASSATSNAAQTDLMTHYRAVMVRASQDQLALAQTQIKLARGGGALPDEIRAARDRLASQQQAVTSVIRLHDNAAVEQRMRDLEDTLAVIEKYVSR